MSTESSLLLHCGGERLTRDQLAGLPRPVAETKTHVPVPHIEFVRQTVEQLESLGVVVTEEHHGVSHKNARYFGVFGLGAPADDAPDDYGLIVGLRNSHDRSYKATLALGTHVFVCDNLSFTGDVTIARRHTRHILRDLPGLVTAAVGKVVETRETMERRVEAYKSTAFDDRTAHHVIVQALDHRIIAASKIPLVLKEWRDPTHAEFSPRTAWSLFNAFTEVLKTYSGDGVYRRTQPLHGVFDAVSNLAVSA